MRKKIIRNIFIVGLAASALSCASTLTVNSDPGNSIVYLSSAHPSYKSLPSIEVGRTPLQANSSNLQGKFPSGPYLIQIQQEGFESLSFLIPDLSAADVNLNLQMKKVQLADQVNNLVDVLFKAQSLTQKGNYLDALTLLEKLEKDFPNIAAIHEMKASIYVLEKNKPSALASLEKAIRLNPTNEEIKSFYRILNNERSPSSSIPGEQ